MKKEYIFITVILIFSHIIASAQLKDILVEKYYISAEHDTDFAGMILPSNSVTYRIFAELEPEVELNSLFADADHPLSIESTEIFFNHRFAKKSLGKNFNSDFLQAFTTNSYYHLDSWLTIGFATDKHIGIPKTFDTDGSIIPESLVQVKHEDAGIPISENDGLALADSSMLAYTIENTNAILTPFLFDSVGKNFITTEPVVYAFKENESGKKVGFIAPHASNIVLLGQITTNGELSFQLNLDLFDPNNGPIGTRYRYVSKDTLTGTQGSADNAINVVYSNKLKFPKKTGCTNPYFTCFDSEAIVDDGSCTSCDSIILGCLDPNACNYLSEISRGVNYSFPELCCYGPDNCGNRDINKVCPGYNMNTGSTLNIFPSIVTNELNVEIYNSYNASNEELVIINSFGVIVLKKNINSTDSDTKTLSFDLSTLNKGFYLIKYNSKGNNSLMQRFAKL
ncbi:MAG: T9SS type A sorting domain-containing protein [Bacteroidales bacterium]|nr:T9SS type A sorting domain-containing protein [Bacteroidales bacterium]MBN2820056.1 T9SS type A sorting domain-containing protein [Bacteroidales bacterium]